MRCAQGDIVVGDIVKISGARSSVRRGHDRGDGKSDQSVLTGESRHIDKKSRARRGGQLCADTFTGNPEKDDEVFSGCAIISGEGFMLCIKVGESTYFGLRRREGSIGQNGKARSKTGSESLRKRSAS